MIITDHQKRESGLVLISAYAPIGVDSDEARTSFFDDYDAALKLCKTNNTVISGTDGNSSMGKKMEMYAVLLEYHILMT